MHQHTVKSLGGSLMIVAPDDAEAGRSTIPPSTPPAVAL
jgi:hypothetical protein